MVNGWMDLFLFAEEVERLEQELEKRVREIEDLKEEQAMALEELGQQEELNKSLQQETQEQKHSHQELGRELDTKNQLVGAPLLITLHCYRNPGL